MSDPGSRESPTIIAAVGQGRDQVGQDSDVIALVGMGDQSIAILKALHGAPGVEVRYVVDADPAAPGAALARDLGIRCLTDAHADELADDPELDLIVETGSGAGPRTTPGPEERAGGRVLDAAGARLVATLAAELAAVEERANADKARYLRQASHQVKSPLSSIQSYVNVILGGYTGEIPERTRDILQKIHSRCEAAMAALAKRRMLADLRCVDRRALETATVDLGEAAGEAVARHAEAAAARGVEVRVQTPGEPALVRCSPPQLHALLSELVENAVVYSHDGGLVEVTVGRLPGGGLEVAVRDQGIGIAERSLARVFDEDYRADAAVKHHQDGAGLGLAIAREIASLNGFELGVRGEEGHGSVFTVTVPPSATA